MDNKMRIMAEEFENTDTGEKVTGITVMIDGKLKQVFDAMIKKSDGETSYLFASICVFKFFCHNTHFIIHYALSCKTKRFL